METLYSLSYPESLVSSLWGINWSIYLSSYESNHCAIHVTIIAMLKTINLGLGLSQKIMCLGFHYKYKSVSRLDEIDP